MVLTTVPAMAMAPVLDLALETMRAVDADMLAVAGETAMAKATAMAPAVAILVPTTSAVAVAMAMAIATTMAMARAKETRDGQKIHCKEGRRGRS